MIPFKAPVNILAIAISFATTILFFSCKKTDSISSVIEQPADFSKKVIASVNGFVTNEYNSPVAGANVQYGESFSTTDQYGYFEIKNATVAENASVVTIKMAGYFKGIKTFIAEAGKKNFCRIKLIPKTISGSVDATSGGEVTLSNGLKVSLPSAGIVDAATKAPYSGTVNVSSFWINPIADDIDEIMPGDLRGINANGTLKSLTSFGMAAVELTGSSGQLLQIVDGKKATLTFPLPNTMAGDAPATIPLWYFDETKGLWIEEGSAIKSGNSYIGDVKHFTFWNCDFPNATASVSFIVKDSANNPLSNVSFEIVPLATNWWSHSSGCTDETGYIKSPVTANTQYKLQLFSNSCTSSFLKTFTVETNAVDLGDIKMPGRFTSTITGSTTNCNNAPLSNGRIIVRQENTLSIITPDNQGAFSYSMFTCDNVGQLDFIAEDLYSSQQGQIISHNIHAGLNNIGNLQACGLSSSSFITNTIDGVSYEYQISDSLYINSWDTVFYAYGNYPDFSPNRYIGFTFIGGRSMGVGTSQRLLDFISSNIPEQVYYNAGTLINITEYGNVGEFIAGNFSGILIGATTMHNYQVSCNFRLRRQPR